MIFINKNIKYIIIRFSQKTNLEQNSPLFSQLVSSSYIKLFFISYLRTEIDPEINSTFPFSDQNIYKKLLNHLYTETLCFRRNQPVRFFQSGALEQIDRSLRILRAPSYLYIVFELPRLELYCAHVFICIADTIGSTFSDPSIQRRDKYRRKGIVGVKKKRKKK